MTENKNFYVTAIVLAGGSGSRMKSAITKQCIKILGESVIKRAVFVFEKCAAIDDIIVVAKRDELEFVKDELCDFKKVTSIVVGGKCRAESAAAGFAAVEKNKKSIVLIHDAARCLVSEEDVERVIRDTERYGAATASVRVTDTLKRVSDEGKICETVSRDALRSVQTPQGFLYELYSEALNKWDKPLELLTDDNMLLENAGIKPFCSETSPWNIKITVAEDIALAEYLIEKGKYNIS